MFDNMNRSLQYLTKFTAARAGISTPAKCVESIIYEELAFLRHAPEVQPVCTSDGNLRQTFAKCLFDKELTALCLSGGGIRSASFCLGILQALAQRGLLSKFDYLSTVSGGGYIGAWLSAWISRNPYDMRRVEQMLSCGREPKQLSNLRDFTNYLTPQSGLMSLDFWTGLATIMRNLALNWVLFLPLFLLFVSVPKAVLLAFHWFTHFDHHHLFSYFYQNRYDSTHSIKLFVVAVLLYFVAEFFTSRELLHLHLHKDSKPSGARLKLSRNRDFMPSGSGLGTYLKYCFLPTYLAACLVTAVLFVLPIEELSSYTIPLVAGCVAIWGLPFLYCSIPEFLKANAPDRSDLFWMLVARIFGGATLGFALVGEFWILDELHLRSFHDYRFIVVFGIMACLLAHLAGGVIFSACSSKITKLDNILEWTARANGFLIAAVLTWTVYASVVLWETSDIPTAAAEKLDWLVAAGGGVSGLAASLFAHSNYSGNGRGSETRRKSSIWWDRLAIAGAIIFSIALAFGVSRLFDAIVIRTETLVGLIDECHSNEGRIFYFCLWILIFAAWAGVASYLINVNKFSLHAFYRNRLIRAYLGASNSTRRPNAFTGFDAADNMAMHDLQRQKPLHLVNIALNLVNSERLAWQERKATSFTISCLHSGNPHLGYRPSQNYGQTITLGTAMAISGAAMSPNMGYHSSPVLAFVMTLFNLRLGWWLGNPKKNAWGESGPRIAFWPLICELLGFSDDKSDFVYLSDGGHFENLGVYEMLRRRCRTIVAVDSGCDPELEYEDLGNLVRKARIDFGIDISFPEPQPPTAGSEPTRLSLTNRPKPPRASPYCILGTINYPAIKETGSLIYIKAALHGDEPEDVWSYAAAHPEFPHESTREQAFSESQFESYRRLGLHVGSKVFGALHQSSNALDLEDRVRAKVI